MRSLGHCQSVACARGGLGVDLIEPAKFSSLQLNWFFVGLPIVLLPLWPLDINSVIGRFEPMQDLDCSTTDWMSAPIFVRHSLFQCRWADDFCEASGLGVLPQ